MNELAERVRLSPSGLTRRFDTLVRRGWVTREPCDDDRRGINARLTPDGLAKHAAAAVVHDAGRRRSTWSTTSTSTRSSASPVLGRLAEVNGRQRAVRAPA